MFCREIKVKTNDRKKSGPLKSETLYALWFEQTPAFESAKTVYHDLRI